MKMFKTFAVVALLTLQTSTWIHGATLEAEHPHKPSDVPSIEPRIPGADGMFHFYALPVGQGDAHVIQCPNGDLSIVDLGTTDSAGAGFWHVNNIVGFLQGQFHLIRNVMISHNHVDHNSFLPTVLTAARGLTGLTNIYITCTANDLSSTIRTWITSVQGDNKIRLFNNGQACGPNLPACSAFNLCPGESRIQTKVMAANLEKCVKNNVNIDSIVFKITYNQVSIMFNGDFEDATTNQNENGHQKALVDFYGAEMKVTVYKISHHGAQNLANKRVTCNAHAPKAIFVSGNPWSSYRHPRCDVIDRFRTEVRSLCRPLETSASSAWYCGQYHINNAPADDKLQRTYWCGENATSINGGHRGVTNNDLAIYTTVPSQNVMNRIEFTTDGVKWGFRNNFIPKLVVNDDGDD